MQLGQPPRQREPETGALMAAAEAGIYLAEALEGDFDLLRCHADPGVGYGERDTAVAGAAHGDDDGAAGPGELDGVRKQVQQDLFQPRSLGHATRQSILDRYRQP